MVDVDLTLCACLAAQVADVLVALDDLGPGETLYRDFRFQCSAMVGAVDARFEFALTDIYPMSEVALVDDLGLLVTRVGLSKAHLLGDFL